jgi:hypothetical protein
VITHSFVSLGAQRKAATGFAAGMTPIGTSHTVLSKDGTRIGYLSLGTGLSVLVVPGVLSMQSEYSVVDPCGTWPWRSGSTEFARACRRRRETGRLRNDSSRTLGTVAERHRKDRA